MNVYYISFSGFEDEHDAGMSNDILQHECRMSARILGIRPENSIINSFPIQKFSQFRQDILEIMIKLRNQLMPSLVFLPSSLSIHQDHKAIFNEGLRAFKHTTCYGYDLPWDTANFKTTSFYSLNANHIKLKIEALKMYQSLNDKIYMQEDFIRGLARVRGTQINVKFAEAFEAIRIVL